MILNPCIAFGSKLSQCYVESYIRVSMDKVVTFKR